jgi:hypothetical protein
VSERTQVDRTAGRTARAQQTRETSAVHKTKETPWVRPTSLDAPPPRTGYRQKWVRSSMFGREDATNWMRRLREGWVPRDAGTVPENFPVPTMQHGKFGNVIAVEGMVLCEMPAERVKQRNRKSDMTAAIEQELQQASSRRHPGFGAIRKAERTQVVREVRAQDDEGTGDDEGLDAEDE